MAIETDKSIFYHIQKTGGSWVRVAMRNAGLKYQRSERFGMTHPSCWHTEHSTPRDAKNLKGLFSYCFIRHPVSWHKSFWSYRLKYKHKKLKPIQLKDPIEYHWNDNFNKYLSGILDEFPNGYLTEMFGEFIPYVDYVGKQERLVDDLIIALNAAGEIFDEDKIRGTGPVNVSKGGNIEMAPVLYKELIKSEKEIIGAYYGS